MARHSESNTSRDGVRELGMVGQGLVCRVVTRRWLRRGEVPMQFFSSINKDSAQTSKGKGT